MYYGGKSTAFLVNIVIQIQEFCIQIQEVNEKAMLSKVFRNQFILLLLYLIYV